MYAALNYTPQMIYEQVQRLVNEGTNSAGELVNEP